MNKKIKIVHIAQSPGGVERYLQNFLKYIDNNKFENILICSYDYKKSNYTNLTYNFENVNLIRPITPLADLKIIFEVRKLIKKYQPDILYCHSSKAGAIGRIANIGIDNKCIYNAHGWSFNMRTNKKQIFIYSVIEKLLSPFCDKIICISDFEKNTAVKNGICSSKKAIVIYNGIDFEEYQNTANMLTRKHLGISSDSYIVGYTGRLTFQKAPDIFIRAARLIKNNIPNAFFLIVGDGEDKKMVNEMIKKYKLSDSTKINGWVENPMSYIKLFNAAVLVSRWEGFGLVLPEYMLAEKPIIATKVDAIPSIIIDRINGTLVNVNDYRAVADGVIELYKNVDLANSYIKAGKEIVAKKFNAKKMVKEYEQLFEDLCSKP